MRRRVPNSFLVLGAELDELADVRKPVRQVGVQSIAIDMLRHLAVNLQAASEQPVNDEPDVESVKYRPDPITLIRDHVTRRTEYWSLGLRVTLRYRHLSTGANPGHAVPATIVAYTS